MRKIQEVRTNSWVKSPPTISRASCSIPTRCRSDLRSAVHGSLPLIKGQILLLIAAQFGKHVVLACASSSTLSDKTNLLCMPSSACIEWMMLASGQTAYRVTCISAEWPDTPTHKAGLISHGQSKCRLFTGEDPLFLDSFFFALCENECKPRSNATLSDEAVTGDRIGAVARHVRVRRQ